MLIPWGPGGHFIDLCLVELSIAFQKWQHGAANETVFKMMLLLKVKLEVIKAEKIPYHWRLHSHVECFAFRPVPDFWSSDHLPVGDLEGFAVGPWWGAGCEILILQPDCLCWGWKHLFSGKCQAPKYVSVMPGRITKSVQESSMDSLSPAHWSSIYRPNPPNSTCQLPHWISSNGNSLGMPEKYQPLPNLQTAGNPSRAWYQQFQPYKFLISWTLSS